MMITKLCKKKKSQEGSWYCFTRLMARGSEAPSSLPSEQFRFSMTRISEACSSVMSRHESLPSFLICSGLQIGVFEKMLSNASLCSDTTVGHECCLVYPKSQKYSLGPRLFECTSLTCHSILCSTPEHQKSPTLALTTHLTPCPCSMDEHHPGAQDMLGASYKLKTEGWGLFIT